MPMPDDPTSPILADCRAKIDGIDDAILELIAERFDWARQIRLEKQRLALAIEQPERYQRLVSKWRAEAAKLGLREDFATELFQLMHRESTRIQAQTPTGDGD